MHWWCLSAATAFPRYPSQQNLGSEGICAREAPEELQEELRHCHSTPSTAGSQPRVSHREGDEQRANRDLRRAQGTLGHAPKCVNKNCSREGRGGKHRVRLGYYLNDNIWIFLAVSLHPLNQNWVLGECPEQPLLICRVWYHKVVVPDWDMAALLWLV